MALFVTGDGPRLLKRLDEFLHGFTPFQQCALGGVAKVFRR
jgi:hypothetical protein